MRTWVADLTGLVIGFALGGAVLVHYLPQIEQMRLPSLTTHPAAPPLPVPLPSVQPPPPPFRVIGMAPPLPEPPSGLPVIIPAPAPMPQITEPDQPDPGEPAPGPGTAIAGTGFFATSNLVITAAHVAKDCRSTEIASPFVPRTPARIVARDVQHDIALLRVSGVTAPAVLAIGRPATANARVFVLGYPATAGLLVPEETWGVLENDKLPRMQDTDPREHVLMEASAVTHGYSGGPIFDPRSGKVIGIVRATLFRNALHAVRNMPVSGLAVGPGSALLDAFLEDEAPGTNAFPADQWGDDPLTVVRHATVHVFCFR